MLGSSKQDGRLVAVKKEACTMDEEIPHSQLISSSEAAEAEEDGIYHLSGKPYVDVVLAKSHVKPFYLLCMPSGMARLLPRVTVPVVLRHGGKNWNMFYIGDARCPRFDKWKLFATENNLEEGDACVFELMETSSTKLRFKVHILKQDLPPELVAEIDSRGKTWETPIQID